MSFVIPRPREALPSGSAAADLVLMVAIAGMRAFAEPSE
jgi:hypothetical protein